MITHRGHAGQSRTMKASEFKTKSLALMDEVAETGGEMSSPRTASRWPS